MKRICIDMDEVIADAVAEHLLRYNRDHNEQLTKADLHGKWLWDLVAPERHPTLEQYLRSEDFFRVLPVMPDVHASCARCSPSTRCSSRPPRWKSRLPSPRSTFGSTSTSPSSPPRTSSSAATSRILQADFLIDDNPRQLHRFSGEGILYTSPHNVNVTGFRRVNSWLEVEQLFL